MAIYPDDHFSAGPRDCRIETRSYNLPGVFNQPQLGPFGLNLLKQVQISTLAFRAGVASAADLFLVGFDTHNDHDAMHGPLLGHLTDAIDYLWTYAEAQGVADRLTVMIASDFGRTPEYNGTNGKDHWPIGSVILMEKNPSWGNRVIGLTDAGHNSLKINPNTLQRDEANGTVIYPKHIHKALRNYLGLADDTRVEGFAFNNTENINFFNV